MYEKLDKIMKNCKQGEKVEIDPFTGEIRIFSRSETGKRIFKKVGNLFKSVSHILPLKSNQWDRVINTGGLKSFSDFGEKLPEKNHNKDSKTNEDVLMGVFLSFVDFNQKPDKKQDSNGTIYTIYSVNGIKGYYAYGNLRMIEFKGKLTYITQLSPHLETLIDKKE